MNDIIDEILQEKFQEYKNLTSDDEKDEFWNSLSEKQKYDINSSHLKKFGDPQYDYLTCWEIGRFEKDDVITNYETMYDIDYEWWEFQRKSELDNINDMKKDMESGNPYYTPENVATNINNFNDRYSSGYKIYLSGDWYRLIENDAMIYGQFISANSFLVYEAENLIYSLQEKHIPFNFRSDFLSIPVHAQPIERYEANGRENEVASLQTMLNTYQCNKLLNRVDFLIKKYSIVFSGKTFRRDVGYENYETNEHYDPFTDFIFYDEKSLSVVSPKIFLRSFAAHQISFLEFQTIIDELKEIVHDDFMELYEENKKMFS